MNRDTLLKIWKDPVWSKVISVGILALITLTYNFITARIQKTSFKIEFANFWTYKIELWVFALILFLLATFFYRFKNNFKYDEETLKIDRALFNQIRTEYSMTDFILEIKGNAFSSRPVKREVLHKMIDILEAKDKADFEFINPFLNELKNKFILEVENLDSVLCNYIFGTNNSDWVSIPSEWEYDQPERMIEAKKIIKKQENILTNTYQEFITKGRRILKA